MYLLHLSKVWYHVIVAFKKMNVWPTVEYCEPCHPDMITVAILWRKAQEVRIREMTSWNEMTIDLDGHVRIVWLCNLSINTSFVWNKDVWRWFMWLYHVITIISVLGSICWNPAAKYRPGKCLRIPGSLQKWGVTSTSPGNAQKCPGIDVI